MFWNIESYTGYKPITTFWQDFTIAEQYGISAVQDTYRRAFDEWKSDYKFLTELVMVLNHKLWLHHPSDAALAQCYDTLWREADAYAVENLTGDALSYFLRVTD